MSRYRSYKITYPDPFLIKTTGGHTPVVTIGSNIIKWPEKKESSEKESNEKESND